jgi:dethiobiotin synthetase
MADSRDRERGQQPSAVPGLLVTGTDTGVGKTFVACLIARELCTRGLRVGVYKPVASGCHVDGDRLVSDDALRLWEAAGRPGELDRVGPQRFAAPLAPHLAALAEGRAVDRELLCSGLEYWRDRSDLVVVEGVGGLLTPVSEQDYVADLACEFGYPLVVVSRNVLGAINQTLQTLAVAASYRGGLKVAGVVLNDADPDRVADDLSIGSNADELRRRCNAPVLAHVRWNASAFEPRVKWMDWAARPGHKKAQA